jgi:hypothetical protein
MCQPRILVANQIQFDKWVSYVRSLIGNRACYEYFPGRSCAVQIYK